MSALVAEELRALRKMAQLIPALSRASRAWLIEHLQCDPLTPEDSLWLAILKRTPNLTRDELVAGGFPPHLIVAALSDPKNSPGPEAEK